MNLPVYSQKAEKKGDIEVNESVFGSKVNDMVLAQYNYIYLSNQREGNAHTKNRGEVSGGGKKPFAQKGTGRARAGSSRSPIWKGGGVTFGPTNQVNWKRKLTKSFRASAFRNAFSKMNDSKNIMIIDKVVIDSENPVTKQAVDLLNSFKNPKKVTIVTSEKNEKLIESFSNLQSVKVKTITKLSAYDVLTAGKILIEKDALEYINNHWAK